MPEIASAEVTTVTDVKLRIKCVARAHLVDRTADPDREEALEICTSILAGKEFLGGSKSHSKALSEPGRAGERLILTISPHTNRDGKVNGVVFARRRADKAAQVREVEPDKLYEFFVENAGELVFLKERVPG